MTLGKLAIGASAFACLMAVSSCQIVRPASVELPSVSGSGETAPRPIHIFLDENSTLSLHGEEVTEKALLAVFANLPEEEKQQQVRIRVAPEADVDGFMSLVSGLNRAGMTRVSLVTIQK